jgi:hypothetical protein
MFVLVTVLATIRPSFTQSTNQPFRINIRATHNIVKVGSETPVEIILTNTSHQEISLSKSVEENAAEFNYLVDVRDGKGKPVPQTAHHRSVHGEGAQITHSDLTVPLKPGQELQSVALLNKLYDVSRPGKYIIRVSRDIPPELGKGVVKSNVITINITP